MKNPMHKRIIVSVDDSPAFAEVLKCYVEDGTQYQLQHFTSARNALNFMSKFPGQIICVFSDIMMQDLDGFQFLDMVRKNPRTKDLPFFFISGVEPIVFQDILSQVEYTAFLRKPLDYKELMRALRMHLNDFKLESAA